MVAAKNDYTAKIDSHVDMCRSFLEVCFKSSPKDDVGALCMLTALSSALAVELSDFKLRKQVGSPGVAKPDEKIKPMPTARGPNKVKLKSKK